MRCVFSEYLLVCGLRASLFFPLTVSKAEVFNFNEAQLRKPRRGFSLPVLIQIGSGKIVPLPNRPLLCRQEALGILPNDYFHPPPDLSIIQSSPCTPSRALGSKSYKSG